MFRYRKDREGGGNGGAAELSVELSPEDDFGWRLTSDPYKSVSSDSERGSGSESASPMLSCIDSDDTENYSLAGEFRHESQDGERSCERIELTSLPLEDLDVNLIEQDAVAAAATATATATATVMSAAADKQTHHSTPFTMEKESSEPAFGKPRPRNHSRGTCYTPERLVRAQEYRIVTPSPRYHLSVPATRLAFLERDNSPKARRCRRRLNYLIDPKQVGANQLKVLLNLRSPNTLISNPRRKTGCKLDYAECIAAELASERERLRECSLHTESRQLSIDTRTPSSISKRSSCEGLSADVSSWQNGRNPKSQSHSSLEDTSGIQSNDWSSETHSDAHNPPPPPPPPPPLCLCDELAIASTNCEHTGLRLLSQERGSSINEVVSILETLDTEPERAAVLLEEDRFCDSGSSHDRLTRLALTIETDANVPGVLDDPETLVVHLRRKVEKLQLASKDIYRDICNLRQNFQYDEKRMADISSDTMKLRDDVNEMRYLDDLLNLLRGELERISKRNWPFVLGHTEELHAEEMNLIV